MNTAAIHIEGPFAAYWETRNSKFKYNIRSRRKRLERCGLTPHLEIITNPNDIEAALDDYSRVEGIGWKGRSGTSLDRDLVARRFYLDILRNFAATGRTRIYRYYYRDKIAATDLCIGDEKDLFVLKIAYDEEESHTAPSFLLRQEQIKHTIDVEKVPRIEFYGPLMDWHRPWATQVRPMYHINYYRCHFLRLAHQKMKESRRGREPGAILPTNDT